MRGLTSSVSRAGFRALFLIDCRFVFLFSEMTYVSVKKKGRQIQGKREGEGRGSYEVP